MDYFHYATLAAYLIPFAIFWHAIYWYFEDTGVRSKGLRTLMKINSFAFLAQTISIVSFAEGTALGYLSAIGAFLISLVTFQWTVDSGREANLALAYNPVTSVKVAKKGPYRWIRHPFYATYMLYWSVIPLLTRDWYALLSLALVCGLYIHAARGEEAKLLAGPLSAEYAEYRSSTGMFFPKLWRRRPKNDPPVNSQKAA